MKISLYLKLAVDGMRKNRKFYIPYILTCIEMVTMYYIMAFLKDCDSLSSTTGARTLKFIFNYGCWIVAIFSCIFLFYTNSFIIRKRKKEFGLYNILGMGKRNINIILLSVTWG